MASSSASTPLSLSSPSTVIDGKALRQPFPSQCVTLPALPPPQVQTQGGAAWKATAYCRRIARNVVSMATGDATAELGTAELPEIVKTVQEAWDKVGDKYAVASLGAVGVVALWGSVGMISAIDRLPLVPGLLEVVGIGYSGWFAYKKLIFKPDRDAFLQKIKDVYNEITGSS